MNPARILAKIRGFFRGSSRDDSSRERNRTTKTQTAARYDPDTQDWQRSTVTATQGTVTSPLSAYGESLYNIERWCAKLHEVPLQTTIHKVTEVPGTDAGTPLGRSDSGYGSGSASPIKYKLPSRYHNEPSMETDWLEPDVYRWRGAAPAPQPLWPLKRRGGPSYGDWYEILDYGLDEEHPSRVAFAKRKQASYMPQNTCETAGHQIFPGFMFPWNSP